MREDEEQNKKYEEIIELLLAAGYFRARIKGLSPFDKVRIIVCVCARACVRACLSVCMCIVCLYNIKYSIYGFIV